MKLPNGNSYHFLLRMNHQKKILTTNHIHANNGEQHDLFRRLHLQHNRNKLWSAIRIHASQCNIQTGCYQQGTKASTTQRKRLPSHPSVNGHFLSLTFATNQLYYKHHLTTNGEHMTYIPKGTIVSFYSPVLKKRIAGVIEKHWIDHLYKVEISEPNRPRFVYITEGVLKIL